MTSLKDDDIYPIVKNILNEKAVEERDILSFLLFISSVSKEDQHNIKIYLEHKASTLGKVLTLSQYEWKASPHYNENFVVLLCLLREIALRYNRAALPQGDILKEERRLLDYLVTQMARETVEQFRILFLNKENQLICDEIHGKGTINHTPVYPREVVRRCLEVKASSIIMVHNHPSGQENPSEGDVVMTQKVQSALKLFKIYVADHYIITRTAQVSFRALGLL